MILTYILIANITCILTNNAFKLNLSITHTAYAFDSNIRLEQPHIQLL